MCRFQPLLGCAMVLACIVSGCGDDDDGRRAATSTATPIATVTPTLPATAAPTPTAVATATQLPLTPPSTVTPSPTPTPTEAAAGEFDVVASEPRFIIPGPTLPAQFQTFASNNNVDIVFYEGRLYLAWRAAPVHFAGPDTRMYIMSSADNGETWDYEHEIFLDTDMREPRLLGFAGYLQLMFFEAGDDPGQFTPRKLWRTRRLGPANWTDLELLTDAGEVPWDLKVRNGVAYRTSYLGEHYGSGETSEVAVFFRQSTDGTTWTNVGGQENIYYGGVSEVAFEFDTDGSLYAVTRNEDGDASGFGSHVCYAPAADLSAWECPAVTDPERYDSPEMFRHGDDIYLLARRDIGGPYDTRDEDLTLAERRGRYLIAYSLRPKRFALYRIDKQLRKVIHVMDLPGVGDTSFPSVQQTGPDTYLIANYTSPLDDPDITWLRGQTSPRGTQIYLLTLTFVPYTGGPRTPTPTWTPTATPTPPLPDNSRRVLATPVFAAPGTPLTLTWPDAEEIFGQLNLGDGTTIDHTTTAHTYTNTADTVFPVTGFVEIAGVSTQLSGAVARTNTRASTPLNGFSLTEPLEPIVQQVIRGVMPEFYYAFDADTFAMASDPTGKREIGFDGVGTAALTRHPDGSFSTAPAEFVVELSGVGAVRTGLYIRMLNAVWTGTLAGTTLASPIVLRGDLDLGDVIDVVVVLAGLDREAAIAFAAGLFGFDPLDPPETVPFRGELDASPASEG
jgi:hypothetical protein